ncbi:MAG: protein kinase [Pyrinomonadaceae bacterium]|nr:protein kinase [Pyrinomonadaceae bacterium]
MKSNDFQNIETIFHQALELTGESREKYLTESCRDNTKLVAEIRSLLSAFDSHPDFLEQPAFDLGLKILETNTETNLSGQEIGFYKVLEKIGSGGMGDVYLAKDTKLDRKVALKFLSTALADNMWAKKQLFREAQAVAMLDHPNICPVYGIEEIGEHSFIVMQYVQGKTLSKIIREEGLAKTVSENGGEEISTQSKIAEQIVSISEQITSAVAAAHERGIIHRDIKTGNIMITPNGQVKVLDFGLAKIIKSDNLAEHSSVVSQHDLIVGTVAYMSPEQLRGENLDFRTDIFSLGTVFSELSSGKNPFLENSHAETISAILTKQPASISSFLNGRSAQFDRIVKKCLEKNKSARYQSAVELILELRNLQTEKPAPPPVNRFNLMVGTLALVILLTLGWFIYQRAAKPRTLAILPFINQTADPKNDYLTVMADTLSSKLAASSQLKIKPLTMVAKYNANDIDPIEFGKELQVEAILVGKVVERDNRPVLELNLLSTVDGGQLLKEEKILNETDSLSIQNNISEQIISKLQSPLNASNKELQSAGQTENPDAYTLYLKGLNFWKKRGADRNNINNARDAFYEAIEKDPNYARAYTGLAYVYNVSQSFNYQTLHPTESVKLAKDNAEKAISIDENLCEAHAVLGAILYRFESKWAEAENEFRRAIELDPDVAQTYYWYSELLAATGRYDEALAIGRKAVELEPSSPINYLNIGRILYFARRFDDSEKQLSAALKKFPKFAGFRNILGLVYIQQQKTADALKIYQELYAENKDFAAMLGYTYGINGNRANALKIFSEMEEESKSKGYLPAHEKFLIYLGLNENDKALAELRKAHSEKFYGLIGLKVDPIYDNLRNDERFRSLLADLNFF